MRGWRVQISPDWERAGDKLVIFRHLGNDVVEVIESISSNGTTVMVRLEPGASHAEHTGFSLPHDVLEAIAEAIKPGPSDGEVKRLEEALTLERRRVDDLIRSALPKV